MSRGTLRGARGPNVTDNTAPSALDKLRARATAMGLHVHELHGDDANDYDFTITDLTYFEVRFDPNDENYTFEGADTGIQAAHWLLDGYERRDLPERPTVVCLCGSGRFRDAFIEAEFEETIAGKIVLTIGCNTKDVARDRSLDHHKPNLDVLHLRKIDLADEVLILNVDGYIGESTEQELWYAQEQGKVIRFLEPEGGEGDAV